MDASLQALVAAIHSSPVRAAIVVAGGASQALSWLLSVPGASRTVLEAAVPYSHAAMRGYMGQPLPQSVSRSSAQLMAAAAFARATRLTPPGMPVVGLACTCALATSAAKKGHHRCHVAAMSQACLWEYSLHLNKVASPSFFFSSSSSVHLKKGIRSRWEEDALTSKLLLQALGTACGLREAAAAVDLSLVGGERVEDSISAVDEMGQIQLLLSGTVPLLTFSATAFPLLLSDARRVVLSGSFNPLHHGHQRLLAAAAKEVGPHAVPCFELAVLNADKGLLEAPEVIRRLTQLKLPDHLAILTTAPLFHQKASLLPDSTFVIGYDTAIRLLDPKYYGNDEANMVQSLVEIANLGCDFVVAGRLVAGAFHSFEEIQVPPTLVGLFRPLSEEKFRADVSSTEIRARLLASQL